MRGTPPRRHYCSPVKPCRHCGRAAAGEQLWLVLLRGEVVAGKTTRHRRPGGGEVRAGGHGDTAAAGGAGLGQVCVRQ